MLCFGVIVLDQIIQMFQGFTCPKGSPQPCKKLRKDEDHPIKTITNYFSPVSKAPDKVLSSPRSSNIADYFKKCSPAAEKEQTPSAKRSSPNRDGCRGKSSFNQTPTSKKTGKLKRRGKRTSLTKRLCDVPKTNESEVVDVDEAENVCGGTGFMGSDTAALLAEICGKDDELDIQSKSDQSSTAKTLSPSRTKLCSKSRKRKPDKDVKSANLQTIRPQELHPNDSGVLGGNSLQSDNNVTDASREVNTGDASGDVGSTITVSFEDFLKSQKKEATNITSDSKFEALDHCPPAEIGGEANATAPPNSEPSLNKVTVQAQIHLTPPLLNSSPQNQRAKRIPSLFLKKGEAEMDVPTGGRHSSEIEQAEHVFQKRKSNVVILEEDFELAVLEVENLQPSKPKSTPAERQQFLKAFKQPREMQKNGVKKSLGKKRDSEEGLTLAAANSPTVHNSEGDAVTPSTAQDGERRKKSGTLVSASKLKKKASRVKQNTDRNTESKAEIDEKKNKVKASSAPVAEQSESPAVSGGPRRSCRQRKPRSPFKSPVQESSYADAPSCTSTPCRKDDIYKAEVITIPSDTESPIRMRFTRVSARRRHNRSLAEDEAFTQRSRKVTGTSKTQDKAKELLEKAKAIRKNMASGETPRRRSGRCKPDQNPASEDPAPVVEIACKSPPKPTKKKKNLRSLNDVLGKKAKIEKNRNAPSGKKKSIGKPPATIVIDDSSEVSESSQDNEQFKAKREFLMSGLPETLKRHISKTAAFLEAYSLSSSSFQEVVHVQQKDGYHMWNLNMPTCPRLTGIRNANLDVPDVATLTHAIGDFTLAKAKPSVQLQLRLAASHPLFSDVIRDGLLEEIHTTNPLFPGKRFLQQFLKKQRDQFVLQETTKPGGPVQEVTSADDVILIEGSEASEINTRTKRKRKDSPAAKLKRLKSAENPKADTKPLASLEITVQGTTRGSLSRAARKQKRGGEIPPCIEGMPAAGAADGIIEDILWTEKYQPLNSSELVGNSVAVKRLHGWLKEWKIRVEKEEKRSQISKVEKDKNDTWDHGDFKDGSDSEDDFSLCNTILISGPAGVGKTAAVYACAQELGFKVFEVNASGQRSGRQILTQLKEATQSHQVDQQGVNAHKPCFFNSHCTTKSPRKFNSPKRVIASPRKAPISPRGSGSRRGLAPKSLANFFKIPVKQKADNNPASQEVKSKPAPITVEDNEVKATKTQVSNVERGHGSEESHKKTATSLILFEEVDVIFDDDLGFLSAVKTFMATTKRPVILTTSDPTFSLMFDGVFEEILFHTPSVVNITSYLQVLCLAENLRTDSKDFAALLAVNKCDIRQSVLNLQFWAKSGGGVLRAKPLTLSGGNPSGGSRLREDLPKCHFGCAENAIGLNNIVSAEEDLICFVKDKICAIEERSRIVQLLTEFQTTNIHFTESNLAFLLPLPLHIVESTKPPASSGPGAVTLNEAAESPVKMSAQMRRKRQLVLLNDSDLFESDSNSSDLLNLPSSTLPPKESEAPSHSVTPVTLERRKLTDTEKRQSSLVHQCLGSLAEFVDNMSYLDCFTHDAAERAEFRNAHWTESRIKNGLCDTLRLENRDWWSSHSSSELKANLEALSYHKCSSDISRFLELCKTSEEELSPDLSLHVPKEHDEVYFSRTTGHSEVAAKRLDVVRSVLSSKSFITLGNRQANTTDYLPALRNMCRFQRLKEEEKTKRRFLHYFEGIHLELPKKTMSSLAADFP